MNGKRRLEYTKRPYHTPLRVIVKVCVDNHLVILSETKNLNKGKSL